MFKRLLLAVALSLLVVSSVTASSASIRLLTNHPRIGGQLTFATNGGDYIIVICRQGTTIVARAYGGAHTTLTLVPEPGYAGGRAKCTAKLSPTGAGPVAQTVFTARPPLVVTSHRQSTRSTIT